MTREEAVNRFKGIRESFSISIAQSKFYPSKVILDELCDMAIEALSAETPTIAEKHQLSEETPTNTPTVFIDGIGHFPKLTETHQNLSKPNNTCEVDLISRADVMGAVQDHFNANGFKGYDDGQKMMDRIKALPSAELPNGDMISRTDAMAYIERVINSGLGRNKSLDYIHKYISALPSAEAVDVNDVTIHYKPYPSADAVCEDTQTEERARFVAKETELANIEAKLENAEKRLQGACTANFVAEQLDRLRNMTDEERWDFLIRFFRPSADTIEFDFNKYQPRVRNKVCDDTLSSDTVSREFYNDAVKANIRILMENKELKEQIESADTVQGEWLEIEDYNGDYHYQCSVCKDEFYLEYGTPKENGYAYCPSCGARMYREDGEE